LRQNLFVQSNVINQPVVIYFVKAGSRLCKTIKLAFGWKDFEPNRSQIIRAYPVVCKKNLAKMQAKSRQPEGRTDFTATSSLLVAYVPDGTPRSSCLEFTANSILQMTILLFHRA